MEFTSINHIRDEFQIDSEEKGEIKSQLKKMLGEAHPDKVGQENYDSDKFEKIKSALSFINNPTTDLVTTEQVTDLIKIVKDLTTARESDSNESRLDNSLDTFYKERKNALLFPKISLSAVTAVLSFLWLFPQTIEDHPVLSRYINFENSFSTMIWLSLLLYTALFWVLISSKERKEKALTKSLKTERTQNKILVDFQEFERADKFTKSDLTDFILDGFGYKRQPSILAIFLGRPGVDQETAESLATFIISKAEKKKLLQEIDNSQSLDDLYEWKTTVPKTYKQ